MGPEELPSLIRLPKWRVRRIFLRLFVSHLYDSPSSVSLRRRIWEANEEKVGTADWFPDHIDRFLA